MLTGASACITGATLLPSTIFELLPPSVHLSLNLLNLLPPAVFEFEDEFEQDGIKTRCNTKLAKSESLLHVFELLHYVHLSVFELLPPSVCL